MPEKWVFVDDQYCNRTLHEALDLLQECLEADIQNGPLEDKVADFISSLSTKGRCPDCKLIWPKEEICEECGLCFNCCNIDGCKDDPEYES